jgi:multidrug resistance protein, MATE family
MVTTPKIVQPTIATELQGFLMLAVPLASAQIAQAAVGFVDTIMMGHLGTETLAAGGLASTTFQLWLNVISGVVMAVSPLVAEAYGAGCRTQITQIVRQGLLLSLVLSLPSMMAMGHLDLVLHWLGQPASITTAAAPYFDFILWGVFPALGFAMLRGYAAALSQAHIVIGIVGIGTLFNVIGNYALGFGKFGFPKMGLAGLGLASGLSFWLMFVVFLLYIFNHPQLKQYRFLHDLFCVNVQILKRLILVGMAIAVTIALEYGLFAVVTFLMGILGTEILAAHQTVYQTMYVIFMIPLGMSYAVTARVGQWVGQNDFGSARRAGYVGIAATAIVMVLTAIALVIFRRQIVGIYIDVQNPANANVIALAVPMLIVSALAQLLDGVQRVAMGALYGLQDTRIPMVLSGIAFWGVGLTSGYLLGFPLQFAGVGLWTGQSIGVAVAALIFVWRFHQLTRCAAAVYGDRK